MTPRLEVEGVTKRFPGVLANDDVSFRVQPGEIHALLGQNGAGKSTLVKMIYGVLAPDAGEMRLDGADYAPARPSDARARGVGMVFQHFSLFDALTVAENIALGIDGAGTGRALRPKIEEISESYGLSLHPDRAVATLSVGERQRVEIVRCLLQDPRLLIMDEPTSVLTPREAEALFDTLARLAADGRSILYISHKLDEIRSLCRLATVLRDGRVIASVNPRAATSRELAEMMVGASVAEVRPTTAPFGAPLLVADKLALPREDPFGVDLKDISFTVRAGEVLGIAGVAGNGQTELLDALSGERLARADAIVMDGTPVGLLGPRGRRRLGLAAVPEERLGHAAAPDMSLWENVLLAGRARLGLERSGFIAPGAAKQFADRIIATFDVRTAGHDANAATLSGGNLQKFVLGRSILQAPSVLAILQPTWGIDAAAAAQVHQAIQDLAAAGAAIILISQDLDELLAITTTLAVISGGRLSPPRPTEEMNLERIGLLMGGAA